MNPDRNLDCYYRRGDLKFAENDLIGAIIDYDRIVYLKPREVRAFIGRAAVKNALGEYENALEDLRRARTINARYGPAWLLESRVLARLGRIREAEASCAKFLDIDPGNREGVEWMKKLRQMTGS